MAAQLTLPTVPVFFATSEGQTKRIAERFASVLRQEGIDSATCAIADAGDGWVDWTRVRGVVMGASIHMGKHQPAAHAFAAAQANALNARPSLFFSVSMAAASQNASEVARAQAIADAFPAGHGWRPQIVASLAGKLAYTQYGFVTRLIMKRISRKEGGPTDTTRDHEFTDWDQVEKLAHQFARTLRARAAA